MLANHLEVITRVYSVRYIGSRDIFGGITELTEVSGTGIEVVPNLPKCWVPVSSPYRTLPESSVRY